MRSLQYHRRCLPCTRRAPSSASTNRKQSERARTMSTHPTRSGMDWPTSQQSQSDGSRNGSTWTEASGPASQGNGHVQVDGEMERLARALGWFSLGLGFAQIAAPGKVAQLVGVDDNDETIAVMRVLGAREIASGLGILTQLKPALWL